MIGLARNCIHLALHLLAGELRPIYSVIKNCNEIAMNPHCNPFSPRSGMPLPNWTRQFIRKHSRSVSA